MLRAVIETLDFECKEAMQGVMDSWRDRGRGGGSTNLDGTTGNTADGDVALPLGPGEWEEGLGLPLCVVCQNASSSLAELTASTC
jgi:dynein light intermediate chain 1, cytosolic